MLSSPELGHWGASPERTATDDSKPFPEIHCYIRGAWHIMGIQRSRCTQHNGTQHNRGTQHVKRTQAGILTARP